MTITAGNTISRYSGDGSSTAFTAAFPFFGPDELRVFSISAVGAITEQVRGTDYTVTGGNGATGTVTFTTAPASGVTISVVRATTNSQAAAYTNVNEFPATTTETALDRLTAQVQDLRELANRGLRAPLGEAAIAEMPVLLDRAGMLLGFDNSGNPVALSATGIAYAGDSAAGVTVGNNLANYVAITGAASGTGPAYVATGSDTNIDLLLTPKGTGSIRTNRIWIGDQDKVAQAGTKLWVRDAITYDYGGAATQPAIDPVFAVDLGISGTANSTAARLAQIVINSDTVDASAAGGLSGLYVGLALTGALKGHRTAITGYVNQSAATGNTAADGRFYTGVAGYGIMSANDNGKPGAYAGNAFGGFFSSSIYVNASYANGQAGVEIDIENRSPRLPLYKVGEQIVQRSTDVYGGWLVDAALLFANQPAGTAPGWPTLIQVGGNNGIFPLTAHGTVLGIGYSVLAGPAVQCDYGIDFRALTTNHASFAGKGFRVGTAGNVGGQTVFGTALQTQGAIDAKSAVVASVTVRRGGNFSAVPALTLAAPPLGGTTATASVATMGADGPVATNNLGSAYINGDIVDGAGYTGTAPRFQLTVVGGVVTDVVVYSAGSVSVIPASPISVTGGNGTGLTLTPGYTILTATVTGAGTNYPEYPPPEITTSAATKPADLSATMTATVGALTLNSGGDVKIGGASWKVGFFGSAGTVKPTVSGSRGSNAALASALTALAGLGLLTDSSS